MNLNYYIFKGYHLADFVIVRYRDYTAPSWNLEKILTCGRQAYFLIRVDMSRPPS